MSEPVTLVLVGEGEQRVALEGLAKSLGLESVIFAGAKMGDALVAEYAKADAFVLTSLKESTGLVLLEAFAAGLPVVATDAVGVRDTVGQDGMLVVANSSALASALDRLVSDAELWSDLAARSASRATRHPWEVAVGSLWEVYNKIP